MISAASATARPEGIALQNPERSFILTTGRFHDTLKGFLTRIGFTIP